MIPRILAAPIALAFPATTAAEDRCVGRTDMKTEAERPHLLLHEMSAKRGSFAEDDTVTAVHFLEGTKDTMIRQYSFRDLQKAPA